MVAVLLPVADRGGDSTHVYSDERPTEHVERRREQHLDIDHASVATQPSSLT